MEEQVPSPFQVLERLCGSPAMEKMKQNKTKHKNRRYMTENVYGKFLT